MRRDAPAPDDPPVGETGGLPGIVPVAPARVVAAAAARHADPAPASPEAQATGRRRPRKRDIRAVLVHISDGDSVRAACRKLGLNHSHVIDALNSEAWRDQYTRAREERGIVFGEKVIAVSDAALAGTITAADGRVYVVAPDQCRVAMGGYQWAASRMAPKLLGDRMKVEATTSEPWRLVIND